MKPKTYEEILAGLLAEVTEKAKVLNLDDSLSELRRKLQSQVAVVYRAANPDSYSYYDYPSVVDVFGDNSSGQVVCIQAGKYIMWDYSIKDGVVTLSNQKSVKQSYVSESGDPVGPSLVTKESVDVSEVTFITEAAAKSKTGTMKIKLIAPGTGSMGHYAKEALQQASKDKIFGKGTQMFFDHPTDAERAQSGTGSVAKLAAVLESDGVYDDNGPDGPGLYAYAKPYKDTADFLKERHKDIGISIAARVRQSKEKVDGVPVVTGFVQALSTDFVSRAGAGGKISTIYESFISSNRGGGSPTQGEDDVSLTPEQEKTLANAAKIMEAWPGVMTRLDRAEEENRTYKVRDLVNQQLQESGLPDKGRARVLRAFGEMYQPPMKDGKLDSEKVIEAVKAAVKDEQEHYQEAGHRLTQVVRNAGASGGTNISTDPKEEQKRLTEASKVLNDSVGSIFGTVAEKKAS